MLTRDQMAEIAAPYRTVSDKIRALARRDVPRAAIANFLGKRYQHVRNVLEGDKLISSGRGLPGPGQAEEVRSAARHDAAGVSERGTAFEPPGQVTRVVGGVYRFEVSADGAIVLPPDVLAALNIRPPAVAVAVFENGAFAFLSRDEALRRARAMIPQWRPGDPLWSDELIAERRREAAAEENDE